MDAASLDELRRRRQRLREELADAGRHAKRAKRQAASAERVWKLVGGVLKVVLIIHTLADGVVDPSVVFLTRKGREHGWPDRTDEELANLVCAAYGDAALDEIVALADMDAPTDAPALSMAVDYVEQWRVVVWARAQNRLGIAPGGSDVLRQAEQRRSRLPVSARPSPWGLVGSAASRKRLSRWRGRWGGRVSTLRAREEVPLADMREKAWYVSPPLPSHIQHPTSIRRQSTLRPQPPLAHAHLSDHASCTRPYTSAARMGRKTHRARYHFQVRIPGGISRPFS